MTIDIRRENKGSRKVLGRGLASLLPEADENNSNTTSSSILGSKPLSSPNKDYFMCSVDKLVASTHQPRQTFNDTAIQELSDSIKENGVIQPLIVRRRGNSFELIAGERRLRASKLAGLKEVPVILKDMSDKVTLQTALVENIQRADLNSIEEGKAYKQLMEEFSLTQEDVAKKVGKERSSVANYLRLLKLPETVQDHIANKRLSMGHARALCSLDDTSSVLTLSSLIIEKNLSVRETEKLVKKVKKDGELGGKVEKKILGSGIFDTIVDSLRERFKTKVNIKGKYDKGKFVIEYYNKDDFDRILSMLYERGEI